MRLSDDAEMGAVLAMYSDNDTATGGYNTAAPLFRKIDTFYPIPRLLHSGR